MSAAAGFLKEVLRMTKQQKRTFFLVLTGVLTVLVLGASDIFLFPAIERTTQGIHAFDLNALGLSFADARQFVRLLSEEGKKLYLYAELPLDCVFPVCYTPFFALSLQSLRKKKGLVFALPFLLAAFDYFENGCTAYLLSHPAFSQTAATIARTATIGKSALMYGTIGILLYNLLKKFLKKRKKF